MTIVLLVARSVLSSMDQAPRSAFLSAVVLTEERTAVMGIVNTVKTMSQSSGPLITGALASGKRFWIAFVIAGSLKASYDLAMLSMFVNTPLEGEGRKQTVAEEATPGRSRGRQDRPDASEGTLRSDSPATSAFEVGDEGSNAEPHEVSKTRS